MVLDDSAARVLDISSLGFIDPSTGYPYTARIDATLKVSANARDWSPSYRVTGWYNGLGILLLFSDSAGNPVSTNFCSGNHPLSIPLPLGTGEEPSRFFKIHGP